MSEIQSFRDLFVWQKSMDLAVRCYRAAQSLPKSEQSVLGYQVRKSSVSIPSNVAEGHSRHSTPHYIQHLWTAHASGAELETQVEVGRRVDLFTEREAEALIRDAQEVGRMINGLVRSLERSDHDRGQRSGRR
jgi:four helix bundle protein